jgi:myo-inositol-1(or 4)-monophosphatase
MLGPARARDIALEAARAAAELLRDARPAEIRKKSSPTDLVTEWDGRSETLIAERLAALAPGVPILGEEQGLHGAGAGARWLVDPIDGTVNFAHGLPLYSISIAYEEAGAVVAGVVAAPLLHWEFAGARGEGATMNGEPMRVSSVARLADAMLSTGFPYDAATSGADNVAEWTHFLKRAGALRRLGSAAIDLALVARGWFDGHWERKLHAWDLAAGVILIEEAGGRVSSPAGGPVDLDSGAIVATNGKIHGELVAELAVVGRSV